MIDGETRRYAATLGRRHFEGTVTLEALFEHFGSSDDPLILALLEAALHQPSRGFAGVSQESWERKFWRPVSGVIEELEKGEEGVVPTRRVYPSSGLGPVAGWAVFTLFAGASAAEHGMGLLALRGTGTLWDAAPLCLLMALMGVAVFAGIRNTLYSAQLFMTRDNPYGHSDHRAG